MKYPQPREDRVIILPEENKQETKTSVFEIPPELQQKSKVGIVKAVGKGFYARDTGVFVPTECKQGDRVIFGAGESITIDGVEHIMLFEKDIKCIIKN